LVKFSAVNAVDAVEIITAMRNQIFEGKEGRKEGSGLK
jgi:hypothetical protein